MYITLGPLCMDSEVVTCPCRVGDPSSMRPRIEYVDAVQPTGTLNLWLTSDHNLQELPIMCCVMDAQGGRLLLRASRHL